MVQELETTEVVEAGLRLAPAAAVSILDLTNICLSSAVYALTTVYILFQIIVLFPKVKATFTRKSNGKS